YEKFEINEGKLNAFLEEEFKKTPPPFYLSCDLRHSGHKVAVVDANLFPAGFNNLCKVFTAQSILTFKSELKRNFPEAKRLLIFPEAHTRNKFYFENLLRLFEILSQTGVEVRVAYGNHDFSEDPTTITLNEEKTLQLHQLQREGDKVFLKGGWMPD